MASVLFEKATAFGVRISKAYIYLVKEKGEKRSSDQLYRSGTSISANIAEAQYAASRADFINKLQIALKEANEARNWINILYRSGYFSKPEYDSIYKDVNELVIILIASIKTAKQNNSKN